MATPLSLHDRLEIAANLALRARVFYDIWDLYCSADTRPQIDTMNCYSGFFSFDEHAHFVSCVVQISALFERKEKTVNLKELINDAERSDRYTTDVISDARSLLNQAKERRASAPQSVRAS
jgi:hypothetical protein